MEQKPWVKNQIASKRMLLFFNSHYYALMDGSANAQLAAKALIKRYLISLTTA